MKYIKLFESVIFPGQHYPIPSIEFREFERTHNYCEFTQSEIDVIKDNVELAIIFGKKTDIELNNGKYTICYTDKRFISYYITKYDDEWWTLRSTDYAGKGFLYLCDQFDELISLLKTLK